MGPEGGGPGANLGYQAGGAAYHPSFPRPASWTTTLGRNWSHDYAEAIVPAPDDSHVWLLTRFATYREFTDTDATPENGYEGVAPSDEYRQLTKTAAGWELRGLDGMVQHFDATGRWAQTIDRNGNAMVADYSGGPLTEVVFPDGRKETFAYDGGTGKLASITEVGVDGSTVRTWSYQWSGDDLVRIDRPDGTAWRFRYDDPNHPGFMTRMILVGTDASERIETAWEYDSEGNVVTSWRGSDDPASLEAVEKWSFAFDDPASPVTVTVTDPFDNTAEYSFGRDTVSDKPRIEGISGDCPASCGLGPNLQSSYDDPLNPLRVTEQIDGGGTITHFSYDVFGQMISRIEDSGGSLERETTWAYEPTFPALPTEMVQPSTEPLMERRLSMTYDAEGNLTVRTIEGWEAGSPFNYSTVTEYNGGGQPTSVDPPGYGTDDQTIFTYDPLRGNGDLIVSSRSDPLIGPTSFSYDDFNRRTAVVDPNLLRTETSYDELNRVAEIRQCLVALPADSCNSPDDLVTTHLYNAFGDLFQTILPEGNVIEYAYDTAGRLIAIERKPDADPSSHGERTVYTLNSFGHRVREEQQRWNGSDWETDAVTRYEYSTRCHLDRVIAGEAPGEESVTENAYDCDGNLERVWDANHPSLGQTAPASTVYAYDALDRLAAVTQPWTGAGGPNAVTAYEYDVQDHLAGVTDAEGTVTTYVYSDRDLMITEVSEVSGTTTHTYNEHGELTSTTDARGVVTTRIVDALDRVTEVQYPDSTLDITYTYDDPGVAFSFGRLTRIERGGLGVDYEYDRFGRMTLDGELSYTYDDNGNRLTIGYPGGVTATYTYDFADRQESLEVQEGAGAPQPVVTDSAYKASGPLASLALGNGVAEARGFDLRYFPQSIAVAGLLDRTWSYQADSVGNITQIDELVDCGSADLVLANQTVTATEVFEACGSIIAGPGFQVGAPGSVTFRAGTGVALGEGFSVGTGATLSIETGVDFGLPAMTTRTYSYQHPQYFLTLGDGPWGQLDWEYDKIGNRLSETRDGSKDDYSYVVNAAGTGSTALLDEIQLGVGGTRDYTFGVAGHLEQVVAGMDVVIFTSDDEGRLAGLDRLGNQAMMKYDGRSFLAEVKKPLAGGTDAQTSEPTYNSNGLLHALNRLANSSATPKQFSYFFFAGKPVAQLKQDGASSIWNFLTTDHLGTPAVATNLSGTETWAGPFEPFGRDAIQGSGSGALETEIYLRLPGQWEDGTWEEASSGAGVYYNVHRWYEYETERYTRVDPQWPENVLTEVPDLLPMTYGYVSQRPLNRTDEIGLRDIEPTVSPKCRKEFADDAAYKDFIRQVKTAAQRAKDAPPCKNNPGRPKKIRVTCGSCFGNCGFAGIPGRVCVSVKKAQQGSCGQGNCLGSTAFHEFIHKCDDKLRDEPMAWGCEKLFYGKECRFLIPQKYRRCPNPCAEP